MTTSPGNASSPSGASTESEATAPRLGAGRFRGNRWQTWCLGGVTILAVLATAITFFPWDWLRGPLNRYVSDRTGRHFEITRRLDVSLGRVTRVRAEGIVFANPAWAQEREFVRADGAEIDLRLGPLLQGRLEMPRVLLRQPRLSLELQPDGRRTWALGTEGERQGVTRLERLEVDRGALRFIAPHLGADIRADLGIGGGDPLPLAFRAQGQWRGQPFTAQGRAASVLALRGTGGEGGKPFPLDLTASAGATTLQVTGTVASLADFDGADLAVRLKGRNLADLYPLARLVLPATPPYAVAGRLHRDGARWRISQVDGRLGRTDLAGALTYDGERPVPLLAGELRSRLLDFDDLAPIVGVGYPPRLARERARRPGGRILPDAPLDLPRLQSMDADVRFDAQRVVNVRQLPLERLSAHVTLEGGVLQLEPLELGVAGGRLAGLLRIDGRQPPAAMRLDLQAQALQLQKLLPAVELNRASVGQLRGHIALSGRGASIARLLGSSSGEVSLLMGPGRISNLLLEIAGLDGAEIVKFLMGHDQRVGLRCAAAGFAVKDGLMTARTLVLDTTDTVIWGGGSINLATEVLDLTFHPRPKDMSILTLRSPLRLVGTLGEPEAKVDRGVIAARAGAALALGALNPLLGLAATVETGPGKDVNCESVLRQAAAPGRR